MTGVLSLRFLLDDGAPSMPSGIITRVSSSDPGDDLIPSRTVLVPTNAQGLSVQLEAGSYGVQAWLPSGEILQYRVIIEQGAQTDLPMRVRRVRRATPGGRSGATYDLSSEHHPLEFQPAFASGFDDEMIGTLDVCIEHPSLLSWTSVRDHMIPFDPERSRQQGVSVHGVEGELTITVDREVPHDAYRFAEMRWWVRARHDGGESLGVLPLPWLFHKHGGDETAVDVQFERTHQRLGVSVRDEKLDALMEYLKAGRISAAAATLDTLALDDTIIDAIRQKRANPLAACAAAYVSLAIADAEQIERWRRWAPNLMEYFPWMPDGAIIRACTLMSGPISESAGTTILSLAKEAFYRGLPYFSVGISHLRQILTIFSAEDTEARSMLDQVRSVNSRCDVGEAFTTLQFPAR